MTARISGISISAFRGIPQIEVDTERKSLLIKGDNGTGKSSIIEALEFFFTGSVSHLEGTQGVSLVKHGPHTHYAKGDVRIMLTFDPGNIILSRTMKTGPAAIKHLENYLNAASKGTFILRRSQILEFINNEPADRYSAIASIIGLEGLDEVELNMQRLRDEMKSGEAAKLEDINDLFGSLSQTLAMPIASFEDALPAINRKAAEFGFPNLANLQEVRKYTQDLYRKIKKKSEGLDLAKNLEELLRLIQEPIISSERVERLRDFGTKARVLIESNARSTVKLVQLLSAGRDIINAGDSSQCPFCGQLIEKNALLSDIETRMKTLAQLSGEASDLRQRCGLVEKDLEEASRRLDLILSKMRLLKGFGALTETVDDERLFLTGFAAKLAQAKELIEPLPAAEFDQHYDELVSLLLKSKNRVERNLQKLGLTDDEKKLLDFIGLLGVVNEKKQAYELKRWEYETSKKRHELTQRMYQSFSDAKKTKTHEIYAAIINDIQAFFDRLHPHEEPRNIQLDIIPTKRASTHLLVDTLGMSQQDPRALESEGHLDSLGICIFLAFVRKFNSDIPLVLLDDVVTTLDSGHRAKLAELLIQEFSDKQLVVTTNDGIWYEQFTAEERAYKRQNDFKHIEIVGWDLLTGPKIVDHKPTWESIDEKLRDGDKVGAGNAGRSYLEWILKRLCEDMQVDVRFKMPPRYEIGDLLPPARSKIAKMVEDPAFREDVEKVFLELEKTVPVSNILSHSNPLGQELAVSEVKTFCLAVRNLHLVFSCPDCGSFLRYYRELGIIHCPSKKCGESLKIKVRD